MSINGAFRRSTSQKASLLRVARYTSKWIVGTKFGPHEILAPIGAGGMGEAFRALVTHVAEALMAAHADGTIHRDLKPENVVVTAEERVEHRTAEQQAELAVIRARDALVRARTLLVNAARGIAKGFGQRLPKTVSETFGIRACALLPETLQPALEKLLEEIGALSKGITGYEEKIAALATRHPEVPRLTSIPGVGTLTGLTFVLTLGRADRFAHSRDVGGYIGLRPRQQQSGARDPQLGIAKSGNKYLRKLLVQCAHHVLGRFGKDSALRQWGLSKAEGSKNATKRVIVAVARKLAVLLHRLWVTGQVFKPFPQMG